MGRYDMYSLGTICRCNLLCVGGYVKYIFSLVYICRFLRIAINRSKHSNISGVIDVISLISVKHHIV